MWASTLRQQARHGRLGPVPRATYFGTTTWVLRHATAWDTSPCPEPQRCYRRTSHRTIPAFRPAELHHTLAEGRVLVRSATCKEGVMTMTQHNSGLHSWPLWPPRGQPMALLSCQWSTCEFALQSRFSIVRPAALFPGKGWMFPTLRTGDWKA